MSVKERIHAVFILQKFVRMSRFLLPAYFDLIHKVALSPKEQRRLLRIKKVYESFRASSETSTLLINSNILDLIKGIYRLSNLTADVRDSETYKEFIQESDTLISKWNRQILN